MTDVLVVGYGNDLRADDGAGRVVADAVESKGLPGVAVRSVSQLSPELALDIAGMDRVVFVDANVDVDALRRERVSPGGSAGIMSHHGDPASLLSLVATVGEVPPDAFVVSIPAENLGLGFELSVRTRGAVSDAIDLIEAMALA